VFGRRFNHRCRKSGLKPLHARHVYEGCQTCKSKVRILPTTPRGRSSVEERQETLGC
jgi:hypothetical protein